MNYMQKIKQIIISQNKGDFRKTLTKYSYIYGTQDFISFTKNPIYKAYTNEVKLLKLILPKILAMQNLNIYELGIGDGTKAEYLLNNLNNVVKYTGIDISKDMINFAKHKNKM